MKRLIILALLMLAGGCCHTRVTVGVHKDWVVDSPQPSNPDLRTKVEVHFEKNP